MNGILDGVRVIDYTALVAGPTAGMRLGNLGADVVKVEPMGTGEPERGLLRFFGKSLILPDGNHAGWECLNLNKRGIAVDLNQEMGQQVMYRLVEKADIFLTNYREGHLQKVGLDYDTLYQQNESIIYVQNSGFGLKGPDVDQLSVDLIGQARGGMMMISGEPEMPPIQIGACIADQISSINLAYGTIAALLAREKYGVGQKVEVSMLGSMIDLESMSIQYKYLTGIDFPKQRRAAPANPLWNIYRCQDGKWLVIALLYEKHWTVLCEAIGMPELVSDPRFVKPEKRGENSRELVSILDEVFAQNPYERWEQILKARHLGFSPVQDLDDLANDPHVIANEYILEWDHPSLGTKKMMGFPIKFSRFPQSYRRAAPQYRQHTEEVLLELGYSMEEIVELAEQGVV